VKYQCHARTLPERDETGKGGTMIHKSHKNKKEQTNQHNAKHLVTKEGIVGDDNTL